MLKRFCGSIIDQKIQHEDPFYGITWVSAETEQLRWVDGQADGTLKHIP